MINNNIDFKNKFSNFILFVSIKKIYFKLDSSDITTLAPSDNKMFCSAAYIDLFYLKFQLVLNFTWLAGYSECTTLNVALEKQSYDVINQLQPDPEKLSLEEDTSFG